jgi:hypothetical protein
MSGVTRWSAFAATSAIALSGAAYAPPTPIARQLIFAFAAKILVTPRIEQSTSDGKWKLGHQFIILPSSRHQRNWPNET